MIIDNKDIFIFLLINWSLLLLVLKCKNILIKFVII